MRRLLLFLTLFCLTLCACTGAPAETTVPGTSGTSETTPVIVTEPAETTLPPETTEPAVTTLPPESAAPIETTVPSGFPYTITISDPDRLIYEAPGFRHKCTAAFGEAGIYTIVEEACDWDGNLWGRLKSGIGWVCLTEPPVTPIFADYAPEHFVHVQSWHCGETEYVTDIGVIPMERITNVQFTRLGVLENYAVEEVLYGLDMLNAEEAVLFSVVFWGDMTTYGVSFTDSNGNPRYYALSISGKDGSLICSEYTP